MEQKLFRITNQYHSFNNNQVLTANQLNKIIDYFEDNSRLSRTLLHGVGIICGLNLQYNNQDGSINIDQGVGITTDGDLIHLYNDIEGNPPNSIQLLQKKYFYTKKFEDDNAKYSPFSTAAESENSLDLYEIFTTEVENSFAIKSLSKLDEMVVIAYLESYEQDGDLCREIDCDNQGTAQVSQLRILLCHKDDASMILEKDSILSKNLLIDEYINLPVLAVPRVLLDPNNCTNKEQLYRFYSNVISKPLLFENLKQGVTNVLSIFGPLVKFYPSTQNINALVIKLENLLLIDSDDLPTDIQYRYDSLKDIIETYNEIKNLLLQYKSHCFPDIKGFPKHLFLGALFENGSEIQHFRHEFYPSPSKLKAKETGELIKSLMLRLVVMINNYQFKNSGLRITPSNINGGLAEHSIPYYYKVDPLLLKYWDFNKTKSHRQRENLSYHRSNLANLPEMKQPLNFLYENKGLLRIEGIIGEKTDQVIANLNMQIQSHCLDFETKHFNLDNGSSDFMKFIRTHPHIEHKAGVEKGGTYILVSSGNKIIADFMLPYRLFDQSKINCCQVKECSYPWISSLKYINNLARSLKGTKSRNKSMPRYYRIEILEYRINQVSLIRSPVTISVPLSQIFLRRAHIIAESINNSFPNGLVFDFNESIKRMLLLSNAQDSYIIRLRDISIDQNSPVYTLSNKGFFKNNVILRKNAMKCRILPQHNEAFYQKLHSNYEPFGKDDDYGKYKEKWDQWNEVIKELKRQNDKRVISSFSEIPNAQKTRINSIKDDLLEIKKNIILKLDGDWVNSCWVDDDMLDHYRENKSNKDDFIIKLINLRKELHNETGETKLSIYITNDQYHEKYDDLIEKHEKFVDFYFAKPTGEFAFIL